MTSLGVTEPGSPSPWFGGYLTLEGQMPSLWVTSCGVQMPTWRVTPYGFSDCRDLKVNLGVSETSLHSNLGTKAGALNAKLEAICPGVWMDRHRIPSLGELRKLATQMPSLGVLPMGCPDVEVGMTNWESKCQCEVAVTAWVTCG